MEQQIAEMASKEATADCCSLFKIDRCVWQALKALEQNVEETKELSATKQEVKVPSSPQL